MFDLSAKDGSVRKSSATKTLNEPTGQGVSDEADATHRLDRDDMRHLHMELLGYYSHELDLQADNRGEMARDEDYYDLDQWDPADAAEVEDRGQRPIVYDVISSSIDWVLGTEKRTRTDFTVLPRRKEQGEVARRKTQLLKYLSDSNKSPFHRSRAFADAVKAGLGWLECGNDEDLEGEPIFDRYEDWRNMLFDSAATEMDLSDGRYEFRTKWVDLDIALELAPDRADVIRRSARDADSLIGLDVLGDEPMDAQEMANEGSIGYARPRDELFASNRDRVRLIEAWYRRTASVYRIEGGPFHNEVYDQYSKGHFNSVQSGEATIVKKRTMRMHVAILTPAGMIWHSESPYRHNKFPFTPIWGFRRRRDGLPYGLIRRVRDLQDDINKRASKAQYILATNKVIMDEGAVDNLDEFAREIARPDAIVVKKPGKSIDVNVDRDLSQWQLELMSRSIAMVQQASGVTDELLGRRTNAASGIAIQRKQDQGSMATAGLFDNLRFGLQTHGEKQTSLLEQFMDKRKAFRITDDRGKPDYIEVNDGNPENDIVSSKADFVISDADWHASLRQAAVDSLLELLSRMPPQIGLILLDMVVENMDLPNRDEMVRRIRQVNGQRDPDADEPTEEETQRANQQAENAQMAKAKLMAEIQKTLSAARKSEAEARRIAAQLVGDNVELQDKALQTAAQALEFPGIVSRMADEMLVDAGWTPPPSPAPAQPSPTPPAGSLPPAASQPQPIGM